MTPSPPKAALRFLRWYCNPKRLGYIEGDLLEMYYRRLASSGKRKADLRFLIDVLFLFRRNIIKSKTESHQPDPMSMLQNNFKIAVRNLARDKAAAIINITGLTVGLTSCLLIALFIQSECLYDQFQPNKDRIARVIMQYSFENGEGKSSFAKKGNFTSTKVAPRFSQTFPEVLKGIRMSSYNIIVRLHDNPVTEKNFMFADSSFFDAFQAAFIHGNSQTALNNPDKVVLTRSSALKYFGTDDVVGKVLLTGTKGTPYEITGVIQDYPTESQLKFDFIASFSTLRSNQEESYFNANYTTYLLFNNPDGISLLQNKLHSFMQREMKGSGASIDFFLERFDKIHLHSEYSAFTPNTSIGFIYMLSGVGVLIIVIVCFTYINLSTAKSIQRAREVGIRKVSGAMRRQLFWQFIGEAVILCVLSVIASFILAALTLPAFNQLIGKGLLVSGLMSPSFILTAVLITLFIGLMAGCYPALILSGLQPASVLKGVFKNSRSAKALQQSLTVFQFAISASLIITTIVIQTQLHFIQNQNLGYDRSHIINLSLGWNNESKSVETLKNELKKNSHVLDVSQCGSTPVTIISGYSMRLPSMGENEAIATTAAGVDADYVSTVGLKLIAGKNITQQQVEATSSDAREQGDYYYILNEAAVKKLGFTSAEDAIGREMFLNRHGYITGVIKNFHFQNMRTTIEPLVLFTSSWGNKMLVKIDGEDLTETLQFAERKWNQLLPGRPFEFSFLDEEYQRMYKSETQLGQMMNIFAGIAIALACFGLFGLSSYMIQQRAKEVSIRKVMGASLWNLFKILSFDFIRLVIIAFVIAMPLVFYLMQQWLNGFAYKIELQIWMFVIGGVSTLAIAIGTIALHGVKAATTNPVKSLRLE